MNLTKSSLAILALMIAAQAALAGDCCCPDCGYKVCQAIPEVKKVKKSYFEVECKDICIPKFRLPWQMCCEPKCGKVKTVKVLKKKSIECEKCGYKWEITYVGSGCTDAGCTDAGCTGCAARPAASYPIAPPTPVPAPTPAPASASASRAPTPPTLNIRPQVRPAATQIRSAGATRGY